MQLIVVRRKAVAFHINISTPGPGMSRLPLLRHRNGAVILHNTQRSISKSALSMVAFDDNRQDRHQPDEDEGEDGFNSSTRRDELIKLEITQILSKLKEYDIRISPTATRKNLIQLIIDHEKSRLQLQSQNRQEQDVDVDAIPTEISEGGVGTRRSTNIPKRRMMREDDDSDSIRDERRRREPPSRVPNRRDNDVRSSSSRNQSPTRQARSRREVRQERNNPSGGVWDDALGVFMPTAKVATKWAKVTTDDFGKRIAKLKRSRRPIDPDSNGVREADWYYVSKDEEVMRSRARAPARPPTPTRIRKKSSKKKAYRPDERRRPKEKLKRRVRVSDEIDEYEIDLSQNGNKLLALPPTLEDVIYMPDLSKGSKSSQDNEEVGSFPNIPNYYEVDKSSGTIWNTSGNITGDMRGGEETQQVKKRRSSNTQTTRQKNDRTKKKKKVYSVYPQGEDDFEFDSFLYGKAAAGAIDSVGEFLADVTSGDYSIMNRTAFSNTTRTRGQQSEGSKRTPKKRYWRDRLAERVDYALGVHEGGEYYSSWQDRMEKNREGESEGNDPLSIFYGKQKKNRRSKKAGPFWEEDGSLMSLMFGRNSDGQQLTFNVSACNFICFSIPKSSL